MRRSCLGCGALLAAIVGIGACGGDATTSVPTTATTPGPTTATTPATPAPAPRPMVIERAQRTSGRDDPMKRRSIPLLAVVLAALWSCAGHAPATSWGWSSWYMRTGMGSERGFKSQRTTCLSQLGVTDPEAVELRSSQDVGYVQCMNAAGWCNQVWGCSAPTVREASDAR